MNKKLIEDLISKGWVYKPHPVNSIYDDLSFGDYHLSPDTSSWLMLENSKGRIFDIHNPGDYEAGWTANLILHLIDMDSKLNREEKIDKILT